MKPLDECVNPDDFTFNIYQRTTTVPRVNQRVGLDEVLVHTISAREPVNDVGAALGADMTKGHTEVESERGTDRDRNLAYLRPRRVAESCDGQAFSIDFNDRDIGLRIYPADRRLVNFPVLQTNRDGLGILDHMAVG